MQPAGVPVSSVTAVTPPGSDARAHYFVGLVVKVSASRAEDAGFDSRLRPWGFVRVESHTSDLKIGTPVAILPDAWRHGVSAGTGRPGVSML